MLAHPFAVATEPPRAAAARAADAPARGRPRDRRALPARRVRARRSARRRHHIAADAAARADARRARRPLVRRLTPPGGARELLPAEYAYTLPRRHAARRSARGRYAFRAVARSPRGGEPATARSEPFAPMRTVTLYGRPGCHLCDDAREVLRVRADAAVPAEEATSRATTRCSRYLERIPVVASTARRSASSSSTRRRSGRRL